MRIVSIILMIVISSGCGMNNRTKVMDMIRDTTSGLVQTRNINGHKFRLSYLPTEHQVAGDLPEWCFKLNIHLPEREFGAKEGQQASFGVDTLFHLVSGKDTLSPLHAMRIANGNMRGIEYMIIFSKPLNPQAMNISFCFSDWLFTHQFLEFPLQGAAIIKIDSLSSRI